METQQNALAQLTEARAAAEVAAAEADLAEKQENLADVLDGPKDEKIAAARSNLSSAWASYNELLDGPSADELTQLSADLKKAEVSMTEAQYAYDEVSLMTQAGMTEQAARLQQTTIDYEAALAAYNETTAPADQSEVQSALSGAQDAQVRLDDLLDSPTGAEIATAQAGVANAEARLAELLAGSLDADRRDAEIGLEQALLDLHQAYSDLAAADVKAPMDGVVLKISAEVGEYLVRNSIVAALADTSQLELTINVAEVDIMQVALDQRSRITIDALPGQTFQGTVEQIAPISGGGIDGGVNYPVTIRLASDGDEDMGDDVRPGMTAVAILVDSERDISNLWLVPADAVEIKDDVATVTVVRGEESIPIEVAAGIVRNDWQEVQSAELQVGDQVWGSVATFVDEEDIFGESGE